MGKGKRYTVTGEAVLFREVEVDFVDNGRDELLDQARQAIEEEAWDPAWDDMDVYDIEVTTREPKE